MTNTPPSGPNRVHTRHRVDWRVALKCADWRVAGQLSAANASRGGLFLLTTRPPELGSIVELSIALPDGTAVQLKGTVQHVVTPQKAVAEGRKPGVGVKFLAEHEAELERLEQLASAAETEEEVPIDEEVPQEFTSPAPTLVPMRKTLISPSMPAKPTGKIAPAIGIDFGTSYSSMSVATDNKVALVADAEGRTLHPTIICYPLGARQPLVGWAARRQMLKEPQRTLSSIKRLLGRKYSDPEVSGFLHSSTFKTQLGPNDSILIDLDDQQLAVPQVCAVMFDFLKQTFEANLGQPCRDCVLSCPVTFGPDQQAALKRAAQLAGLNPIGFIEEPVAAAMAYGFGQQKNELVAVYDFGGGTFDFSVLDISRDNFRVLATKGDAWLGGDDFDLTLTQASADAFWRATKIELRERIVEWGRLLAACEQTKRELSTQPSAAIIVENIVEYPKKLNLKQKIERAAFEKLCQDFFSRSLDICKEALDQIGLDPPDITQVIVTGGISRIPFIRAGLAEYFEREITSVVDPEAAICLGAGLQAARLVKHEVSAL